MRFMKSAAAAVVAITAASAASAQDYQASVLGWYPNQPQTDDVERPFFEGLSDRSGVSITVEYRNLEELNLEPFEHLRTLETGIFDIMTIGSGFVSGDDPMFIGHDLPALSFDFDEVRRVIDAWFPVLEEHIEERYDAKLLTMAPFPPQILFCQGEVDDINDLAAKRIRVSSAAASALTEAMGGIAVTMAGPEVYQGLQRGVIECGSTGTGYANSNSWYEVTDVVYDVPLGGYSIVMHVARNDFLDTFEPGDREALVEAFSDLEAGLWDIAEDVHMDALRCNLGEEPCDYGQLGDMRLVTPDEEDRQAFREMMVEAVLPGWIQSCEAIVDGCGDIWYDTVGLEMNIQR